MSTTKYGLGLRRNIDLLLLAGSGLLASASFRARQLHEDRIAEVNLHMTRLQARRNEARRSLRAAHRSLLDDDARLASTVDSIIRLPSTVTATAGEASATSALRDYVTAPFSQISSPSTLSTDISNAAYTGAGTESIGHKQMPQPKII